MRLLLDENVDARLRSFLVELGHDVTAVIYDYPAALDDDTILSTALSEDRVILTGDTDFGELIYRDKRRHAGVILLRLRARALWHLQARVTQAIERPTNEPRFLVVTDRQTRVR
jgi:predicted nuclease of predicted toxin-antitoxin system